MEAELSQNLLDLCARYCALKKLEETTVGRLCAADGRFFSRIRAGKTFTVNKYDDVVCWMSRHWPDDADWPDGVTRPGAGASSEQAA